MWVGDRGPGHADVIIDTEIQEFFSDELSVVVGNDRVRNPEIENDVLDEIHILLGAILSRGFGSTHLVNLSTTMSRWVKPSSTFLKGPRRSKPHTVKS
jgi:hypothetical protein